MSINHFPGKTRHGIAQQFGRVFVTLATALALAALAGCPMEPDTEDFIPVTGIAGVPEAAYTGTSLKAVLDAAAVEPQGATKTAIVWSVKTAGSTGVTIDNNFTPAATGTMILTATVVDGKAEGSNFTKDFTIQVSAEYKFVAVENITGVATGGKAGVELTLGGNVFPTGATHTTIIWTVKDAGGTGVTAEDLTDGKVTPTAGGTLTLTARVANGAAEGTDFTKEFAIPITPPDAFVPVTDIGGVPAAGRAGVELDLSDASVSPGNATHKTIAWAVTDAGGTGVATEDLADGKATPAAEGTLKLTARVANGTAEGTNFVKEFTIAIAPADTFVAVTDITVASPRAWSSKTNQVIGAVVPSHATNTAIVWSIKDAGGTAIASITGDGIFTAQTQTGALQLTARVAGGNADGSDFTKDIAIAIESFTAVYTINGVPQNGVTGSEVDFSTASISNASYVINPVINWSLASAGETGVTSIAGNKFTATAPGTVTIKATVADGKLENNAEGIAVLSEWTQDYTITIVEPAPEDSLDNLKADITNSGGTETNPYTPAAARLAELITTDVELSDLLNHIKGGSSYVSLDLSDCGISSISGVTGVNYVVDLTLPTDLVTINGDFKTWKKLKTLTIAAPGLVTLPNSAFYSCPELETVTLTGCTSLTAIGGSGNSNVFRSCNALKNVALPDSVETIGKYAFMNCPLQTINIPTALTTLGDYAFYGNATVTGVVLPDTLTTIGSNNFQNYNSLTSVTVLATTPPTLGASSFSGCHADMNIYVPGKSVDTYEKETNWSSLSIQAIPEE
jgi:hypothetical protein